MRAGILRREVAAARVHLLDEPASVRQHHGDDGARCEATEVHAEPVALRARVVEQDQLAADRVDRDVDAAVVVEVGCRKAAANHTGGGIQADGRCCVRKLPRMTVRGEVLEDLDRLCALAEPGDGNRAVCEREVEIPVEVEIDP